METLNTIAIGILALTVVQALFLLIAVILNAQAEIYNRIDNQDGKANAEAKATTASNATTFCMVMNSIGSVIWFVAELISRFSK